MALLWWKTIGLVFLFSGLMIGTGRASAVNHREPYIVYGNGALKERDLPQCESRHSACNIVHNRFWLSRMVVQLCRCQDQSECPHLWKEERDPHTMMLNSRAQFKFCSEINHLPLCHPDRQALITKAEKIFDKEREITIESTEAKCFCPKHRYYERLDSSMTSYPNGTFNKREIFACRKLRKCNSGDFCGHITTDLYQTYFRCTCPPKHMCIISDRTKEKANEAMYDGEAYRGICVPRK